MKCDICKTEQELLYGSTSLKMCYCYSCKNQLEVLDGNE